MKSGCGGARAFAAFAGPHEAVAEGNKLAATSHVVAVQLAALGLQPSHKPIEITRHLQRRSTWRTLNAARPRDEHLEIVHPPEQVLHALQHTERGDIARSPVARGRPELERVAQLLDG